MDIHAVYRNYKLDESQMDLHDTQDRNPHFSRSRRSSTQMLNLWDFPLPGTFIRLFLKG